MQYLILLIAIAIGFVMIKYSFPLVRTFGTMAWAERMFGASGSYAAWKIGGFIVILLGFLVVSRPGLFGL